MLCYIIHISSKKQKKSILLPDLLNFIDVYVHIFIFVSTYSNKKHLENKRLPLKKNIQAVIIYSKVNSSRQVVISPAASFMKVLKRHVELLYCIRIFHFTFISKLWWKCKVFQAFLCLAHVRFFGIPAEVMTRAVCTCSKLLL